MSGAGAFLRLPRKSWTLPVKLGRLASAACCILGETPVLPIRTRGSALHALVVQVGLHTVAPAERAQEPRVVDSPRLTQRSAVVAATFLSRTSFGRSRRRETWPSAAHLDQPVPTPKSVATQSAVIAEAVKITPQTQTSFSSPAATLSAGLRLRTDLFGLRVLMSHSRAFAPVKFGGRRHAAHPQRG